ncbi:MAG: TetR/AcrR family transcriptional regulator [Ktedonobacterales bacterium]|nr:TetR/AcrR family transcriptional regulator [Ktedonobacterales bacterium]
MPRRPPTVRTDTEETRRAILQAARQLFMEQGFRAVTTRMVAEASGVKQPLIYYHFADKEALYLEVQRDYAATCRAALERIAARQSESVPERLRHVARYLRQAHQMNVGLYIHEMRHDMQATTRAELSDLFRVSILAPIMGLFEEGVRSGFLAADARGVTPRLATYMLLSAVTNFPTPGQGNETSNDIAPEASDAVVHALIYGMVARPPFTE